MELLDNLVRYSAYKVVIEPKEIRIIPRGEAVEFWKAWLNTSK